MKTDRPSARKRAVERAIDREVTIRPSSLPDQYIADSISGKQYRLLPFEGGYRCVQENDEQCPAEKYHGTCKHVAALDLYFLEHGIPKQAHARTVTVRANGKDHTLILG